MQTAWWCPGNICYGTIQVEFLIILSLTCIISNSSWSFEGWNNVFMISESTPSPSECSMKDWPQVGPASDLYFPSLPRCTLLNAHIVYALRFCNFYKVQPRSHIVGRFPPFCLLWVYGAFKIQIENFISELVNLHHAPSECHDFSRNQGPSKSCT